MNQFASLLLPLLLNLLTKSASTVATAFASVGRQTHPAISDADLSTYVDGQLKHWARTHLGFFGFVVDILWTNGEVQSIIAPIVAQAVVSTKSPVPSNG